MQAIAATFARAEQDQHALAAQRVERERIDVTIDKRGVVWSGWAL
jgi:hypothetical protein